MKKRDLFLLLTLLLAGGLLWFFLRPQQTDNQSTVRITVDGSVCMKSASCPDQICVKTKAIRTVGSSIICLPNKVIVEIIAPEGASDADVPDVVVH